MAVSQRWRLVAAVTAVSALALGLRLAAVPGADLHPTTQRMLGRAPRLDGYWYTRAAVAAARDVSEPAVPSAFDRPLYTTFCRGVFALSGSGPEAIALPAILAGAASTGILLLLGLRGGFPLPLAALAALFAASNWIAILHDREPLIYSSVTLALLLSLLVWLEGFRRRLLFLAGWAALALTVLSLKETVLLAAPGLAVAQLAAAPSARARRQVLAWLLAAAGAAAALSAILAPSFADQLVGKVLARTVLPDLPFPGGYVAAIGDLPKTIAILAKMPALAVLALVGLTAVLLEGAGPVPDRPATFRRLLVAWLAIGCVIVAAFAYRPTRYLLCLFPPAFLLAAHGAGVLLGRSPAPVRRSRRGCSLVLFFTWWLGLAALYAWLLPVLPPSLAGALPSAASSTPVRLGVAAFLAALLASYQARTFTAAGALRRAPRYAIALVLFIFVTDARNLVAHLRQPGWDDRAARVSFDAMLAPGARVQGYAAGYLAFGPAFSVAIEFDLRPARLLANPTNSTHIATLWIPELGHIEELMAQASAPLSPVADVVIGRERYRVYRRHDATARGYVLSPFEGARQAASRGDPAAGAAAFRGLIAAGVSDPLVRSYAGHAIARVDREAGTALLQQVIDENPRQPIPLLHLADVLGHAGHIQRAETIRRAAASLLPHELIAGLGAQPDQR